MQAAVTEAYDLASSVEDIAQQAIDVANATGQHFWPDTDGVHVTEVTQDEWSDSTGTSYHSGANVLLNALGQLFRNGLNNLLALLPGTATTYTETLTPEYNTTFMDLTREPDVIVSVTINGVETTDYTLLDATLYFTRIITSSETIVVTYRIGGSSIALFDGQGNDAENVMASYGASGATIGYERSSHIELGHGKMKVMDGSTPLASFGQFTKFYAGGNEMVRIDMDGIDMSGSPGATFVRFNESASISSDLVTMSGQEVALMDVNADSLLMYASMQFPDSTALPNSGTSTDFFVVGITSFANGGVLKYKSLADMQSWLGGGVTTGTVTRGAAASSIGTSDLRKYGHVVTVTLNDVTLASAIASGSTSGIIATIPSGFRPPATQRVAVALSRAGTYANVWAAIGTGGAIVIANRSDYTIPTAALVSLQCTYIVS